MPRHSAQRSEELGWPIDIHHTVNWMYCGCVRLTTALKEFIGARF